MKNLPNLIKGNPIVVVSIVVAVIALAALFFVVRPSGKSFLDDMAKRKQDIAKVNQLMKTPVIIPGKTPDAQPETIHITVNDLTNQELRKIYSEMEQQRSTVFDKAREINKSKHMPMLDKLFPDTDNEGLRFAAKTEYIKALKEMLDNKSRADELSAKDVPRLNAGPPVSSEKINEALEKVKSKFLNGFFPPKNDNELTNEDRTELAKRESAEVMKLLKENARKYSMYAVDDEKSPDFPFHVGPWATEGGRPQMKDIWEGQMALWIQSDIARAIALANRNADGKSQSVLNSPIKQLVSIFVVEGYVGYTSAGGMARFGETREKARPGGNVTDMMKSPDYLQKTLAEYQNFDENKQPLPEAFNVSMSGRIGNPIYDVRHVEVELVVDFKQMPRLFEAIGKTNFMTVLSIAVSDIDEYEALEAGYLLGDADCVQVKLLLETIWLRDWTAELMPEVIRTELGAKVPEKKAETPATPTTTTPATTTPAAPAAPPVK